MEKEPIAICKEDVKKGETVAYLNVLTGEIHSSVLEFLPGGKERLLSWIVGKDRD